MTGSKRCGVSSAMASRIETDPCRSRHSATDVILDMPNPTLFDRSPQPSGTAPEKVDISRLPETGDLLFGRRKEMTLLDDGWNNDNTNVVVLKAAGGVGKSTLMRVWTKSLEQDNYRGANPRSDPRCAKPRRDGVGDFENDGCFLAGSRFEQSDAGSNVAAGSGAAWSA